MPHTALTTPLERLMGLTSHAMLLALCGALMCLSCRAGQEDDCVDWECSDGFHCGPTSQECELWGDTGNPCEVDSDCGASALCAEASCHLDYEQFPDYRDKPPGQGAMMSENKTPSDNNATGSGNNTSSPDEACSRYDLDACMAGQWCVPSKKRCMPHGTGCFTNEDCGTGEVCKDYAGEQGRCGTNLFCTDDFQCTTPGTSCDKGANTCRGTCVTDFQCAYGQTCRFIGGRNLCSR